jgi:DNA-binding LacI/PurR family transcriptional regulator
VIGNGTGNGNDNGETRRARTIHDIARIAGVSAQTVSRVLNDRPDVAPATRKRVQEIIEEVGFVPAAAAQALPGATRALIGILTDPSFARGHFYPGVVEGAAAEAATRGLAVFIVPVDERGDTAVTAINLLIGHRVAGVIVARAMRHYTPLFEAALARLTMPTVSTGYYRDPTGRVVPADMDNRGAGRILARHLISLGHRKIALLRGSAEHGGGVERAAGHYEALAEAGIEHDPSLQASGPWDMPAGLRGMREILSREVEFTAVACHHDEAAIGAMRALVHAGHKVPEDVAVVGMEDTPVAAYLAPALTTVRAPAQEIGIAAVRHILDGGAAGATLDLPGELIVRESCGARPKPWLEDSPIQSQGKRS